MMEYKGYQASYKFDEEGSAFIGDVVNIADTIFFYGDTLEQLNEEFHFSIDDYLAACEEKGRKPDKPFTKGIRIKLPETVYSAAEAAAKADGKGLDTWFAETIEKAVSVQPLSENVVRSTDT